MLFGKKRDAKTTTTHVGSIVEEKATRGDDAFAGIGRLVADKILRTFPTNKNPTKNTHEKTTHKNVESS